MGQDWVNIGSDNGLLSDSHNHNQYDFSLVRFCGILLRTILQNATIVYHDFKNHVSN